MQRLVLRRLKNMAAPVSTAWLLESCATARERFLPIAIKRGPHLEAMRQHAIITSTESSNRIEGVEVEPGRLLPLVLQDVRPRDRSEEEIVGYRKALELIQADTFTPPLANDTVLGVHAISYGGPLSSDAGQWKRTNNDIIEIDALGRRKVRFVTATWGDVPELMEASCSEYNALATTPGVPPLLLVFTWILDFLCIHPFRDGNGRASRLLTAMMLRWHGFMVCDYVSLEQIIEEDKESYYAVLQKSTEGWHTGDADPSAWWNFMLGVLSRAHQRAFLAAEPDETQDALSPKTDVVRSAVQRRNSPFTRAEIAAECPGISDPTIQFVFQQMKAAGEITLTGRGRGAVWRVVRR